MRTHLANLVVIKEHLTEIDCPISDASFTSYIYTSLSLAPSYKPLLTTLAANAHVIGKPMSSNDFIWHLNEEANNTAVESSINKQHEAMITAHAKAKGDTKDTKSKSKSKGKGKDKRHCRNCSKDEHTDDQCFEEGGGIAGKAPEWWLKKHKAKGKAESANVTESDERSEKAKKIRHSLLFSPLTALTALPKTTLHLPLLLVIAMRLMQHPHLPA
ncbi:hypothetical protein C0993_012338 [Termitomyces sp. T159_Od127]|nr:hypothetical protein C0993_012338 [Termitomyces sp. T159_Od127]